MKKYKVTVTRDDGAQIIVKNVKAMDSWHAQTTVWLTKPGIPLGWTRMEDNHVPEIKYLAEEVA